MTEWHQLMHMQSKYLYCFLLLLSLTVEWTTIQTMAQNLLSVSCIWSRIICFAFQCTRSLTVVLIVYIFFLLHHKWPISHMNRLLWIAEVLKQANNTKLIASIISPVSNHSKMYRIKTFLRTIAIYSISNVKYFQPCICSCCQCCVVFILYLICICIWQHWKVSARFSTHHSKSSVLKLFTIRTFITIICTFHQQFCKMHRFDIDLLHKKNLFYFFSAYREFNNFV